MSKEFTEIPPQRVDLFTRIVGMTAYTFDEQEVITSNPEGEYITSALPGVDQHVPLFDIDFPAELVPSKTSGHFHLVLHRPIPWRAYKRAMKGLMKAGLLDERWYRLTIKRRQGLLRRHNLTPSDVSTTVDNT